MSVLYVLIPIALVLSGVFVWAFLWAVRLGQFDDVKTPSLRILHDDEKTVPRQGPSRAIARTITGR